MQRNHNKQPVRLHANCWGPTLPKVLRIYVLYNCVSGIQKEYLLAKAISGTR
jgi:hypothetical protein